MRRLLLLALPFALSGCMLELLTSTAIQGELAAQNAQSGMRALDQAKELKARTETESAIRAYQAEFGKFPASLKTLVPSYLPGVPTHADGTPFGYDADTGVLLDSPAPAPQITQEDRKALAELDKAVYAYWEATGYYPPSLASLAPQYLTTVPQTSSGEAFGYDPQSGAIYHPSQPSAAAPAGAPRAVGGGGAGPLGEAQTSIAIQGQLQNMNTSGTATANGAARRGLSSVNNNYNQQQQRALDEIDQ